jgi:hypothetical protein
VCAVCGEPVDYVGIKGPRHCNGFFVRGGSLSMWQDSGDKRIGDAKRLFCSDRCSQICLGQAYWGLSEVHWRQVNEIRKYL